MMLKTVVSRQSSVISTLFLFLLTTYNLQLTTCFAQTLSSTELINHARQYNGKTVVYEGEVIGEVMIRGESAWINVNDGKNAIGVWLPKDKASDILYTGSYKSKGDWIEITGTFQQACSQHGGDLDIHANQIKKISQGRIIKARLNPNKKNLSLVLLGILGVIWILRQLVRR